MRGPLCTRRLGAVVCLIMMSSCATPVAPSGGPADDIPPEIIESDPPPDAVNVRRESVRLTFSEYIDEASFSRAFSITPAFSRPPQIVWRRRSVEIRFPEPLRENTTYVVMLDRNLRDLHGVALPRPVTIAFSTGPTISRGTIEGRVISAHSGQAAAGVDVFAYALEGGTPPPTLPERPEYRTQTDQSGVFTFEYLTEQPYYVIALRDQNRSLRPDPQEEFASPPIASIMADTTPVAINLPWIMAAIDTTRPSPQRVQSLSTTRHRLRLSEPVSFAGEPTASGWSLVDSASAQTAPVRTVYMRASEPREVYFVTDALGEDLYSVAAAALVDTAGNPVMENAVSFMPSADADTVQHRLLTILPQELDVLPDGVHPTLRFNAPVTPDVLASTVSVSDSTGKPISFTTVTENGTDYQLHTDPPLSSVGSITIGIEPAGLAGLDSTLIRTFTRLSMEETGEISGVIVADGGPVHVEIRPVENPFSMRPVRIVADSSGAFVVRALPAGMYRLQAFVDEDDDGRWDPGMLTPHIPPEPILWYDEPIRVRARWESALPDTLRFPSL